MKIKTFPVIGFSLILVLTLIALSLMTGDVGANDKRSKVTVCSNPHPQQLCSVANTCGSSNSPCVLEIRRTGGGDDASVTPNIPNFPKERPAICIATGTSVT
jgi:hypothetical protein